MRATLTATILLLLMLVGHAAAADPLAEARRLYNQAQYDQAEKLARDVAAMPGRADAARVVLGRIRLERFRQSANAQDLARARDALRMVDATALEPADRVELTIGLAEALYLEQRYGAAAELFESVRQRSSLLGPAAHERVLDWWATALDRHVQGRSSEDRTQVYSRILDRMEEEVTDHPGSTAAGYWIAAAARNIGDIERAWSAALAGWLRASLAEDRGAALRADLDRLVTQALIPERASKLTQKGDLKEVMSTMTTDWETFKRTWSR
jgi:hypothetical protein